MSGATVHLHCGGCTAEVIAGPIRREFHGINGKEHGFGSWRTVLPDDPEGWMMFDPYSQCTYCPVCVEELFGPPVNLDAAAEIPPEFDHYALLA